MKTGAGVEAAGPPGAGAFGAWSAAVRFGFATMSDLALQPSVAGFAKHVVMLGRMTEHPVMSEFAMHAEKVGSTSEQPRIDVYVTHCVTVGTM
jgi:hypothetical protein